MSIVTKITKEVKATMNKYAEQFKQDAIKRVEARAEQPANEMERGWAIDSEWNSIQSELVKEAVHEAWVEMFKQTIDQANSSYDREFWLRMLKVIDAVAKADSCYFDPRNAWTKEVCERMIFSYTHSVEVDILRNMTVEDLYRFRLGK